MSKIQNDQGDNDCCKDMEASKPNSNKNDEEPLCRIYWQVIRINLYLNIYEKYYVSICIISSMSKLFSHIIIGIRYVGDKLWRTVDWR